MRVQSLSQQKETTRKVIILYYESHKEKFCTILYCSIT